MSDKVKVSIFVTPATRDTLRIEAAARNLSVSAYVAVLVDAHKQWCQIGRTIRVRRPVRFS